MSKQGKRKITVELPKAKDLANRPSVFERLGTKKNSSAKKTIEHCRQWALNGSCAYGKSCKFSSTHTLISPSKQRAAKDTDLKRIEDNKRLLSAVIVRSGRGSPDAEIENWDQNDLEYADTDVLEKRRLQLQRELELQLKMDSGKDMRKDKKKAVTSSSSSRSSSSSSVSSSSSDGSSSSSSSGRDNKRKGRKGKIKRNSSSSSEGDVPSKRKFQKSDLKRDKSDIKKNSVKKDDKLSKKTDNSKKKTVTKVALGKKSLSPGKKSGGTPPITSKSIPKNVKHGKSPIKRDRNRSASPHSTRDRNKDRDKDRERERPRGRSRSPKKARSRSPRRHGSNSKDTKRKASSERSRPVSPKKQTRKEGSSDKHRKRSVSRDRERLREHKDRSLERRKDKHDEKDRHDRKDRGRNKDNKREDKRRGRGDRGGLGRGGADKGLEKPSKPMERLLPRPEERLAALAAISNRVLETDKNSTTSKDNPSERGGRKQDRLERDRSGKRDRLDSMDRGPGDYEMGLDRPYERDRSIERYEGGPREDDRSPGYGMSSRDRHYDPGYDISGPPRGYQEDDDRMYNEHMPGQRGDHAGYDDRRPLRDRSWEGRAGSIDHERGSYMHPHKDWENDDYRSGDWGRERWPMHEPQMGEWGEKEDLDGWHHRGHTSGPHRGRMNENFGRGMHGGNKRRAPRPEQEPPTKKSPAETAPAPSASQEPEAEDKPIPDDLSEISDDPDDILNREDMADQAMDDESQNEAPNDETGKLESSEKESTQDTSGMAEDKDCQDAKDDEDVANLDFEEISDGELEEERTRAGLGDALGVDWASLVADVRRREQTTTSTGGARDRWRPERVLPRIGLSFEMAGKATVQEILRKNALSLQKEHSREFSQRNEDDSNIKQNGELEDVNNESEGPPVDLASLHSVAAIQVAIEKRKKQRSVLFGSGCEITRGLSARRDLALRRYLCNLTPVERTGQNRISPQPTLFHAARALLLQSPPVSG